MLTRGPFSFSFRYILLVFLLADSEFGKNKAGVRIGKVFYC